MAEQIKEVIKQEYVKCAQDPAYFMKKYCMIQHPIQGKIPFDLYDFQEKTNILAPELFSLNLSVFYAFGHYSDRHASILDIPTSFRRGISIQICLEAPLSP